MRQPSKLVLALVVTMSGAALPPAAHAKDDHTTVTQGQLSGVRLGKVTAYLGVPYAQPPVANLRWRAPQGAAAWTGVRNAHAISPSCYQPLSKGAVRAWTEEYQIKGGVSEDCLYLNVWTPADAGKKKLPVMVWIHGGAFSSGSTSVPVYDGADLAKQGIVVVSINYRLGIYGFLNHPDLSAESPTGGSGNYGLLDQIAALRWVKENAAAFGGDASQVTIAGQSSGALSVHTMIASPVAKGLFQRAIAQSGSYMRNWMPTQAQADDFGAGMLNYLGYPNIAAFRALSTTQMDGVFAGLAQQGINVGFGPNVDGHVVPIFASLGTNLNDTPILTGMTADEASSSVPGYGTATTASLFSTISTNYGGFANEFWSVYNASTDAAAGIQSMALMRDSGLGSMHFWGQRRLATTRQPIYAYIWAHVEPGPDAALYRAFHSSEMPYVFGTLDAAANRPFTSVDRRVSRQLGSYWVNFVKTGNPNGPGLPAWPALTKKAPQIMELGHHSRPRPILEANKQSLFERFVESGGGFNPF